jgi:hypothetical protein
LNVPVVLELRIGVQHDVRYRFAEHAAMASRISWGRKVMCGQAMDALTGGADGLGHGFEAPNASCPRAHRGGARSAQPVQEVLFTFSGDQQSRPVGVVRAVR